VCSGDPVIQAFLGQLASPRRLCFAYTRFK
jgi:hypothetical protein